VSRDNGTRVSVCAKTDRGRTRDHNEDTFLVADLTSGDTTLPARDATTLGSHGVLLMVAEGLGGAAAGELASAMAADVLLPELNAHWVDAPEPDGEEFIRQLSAAVELANVRIHDYAREHPDSRGMGTTATVVGVLGTRLYLLQVGDSRAYLVRQGRTVQLTKDQSLMQRLIDAGELTEEEAAQSERRNIILQALGPDPKIRADVTYQDLARGDLLLLCSDGLTGQVKREEIGDTVSRTDDLEQMCDDLIALANSRGGPDNITVIAARFDGGFLPDPEREPALAYRAYPGPPDEITDIAEGPEEPELAPVPIERSGSPMVIGTIGLVTLLVLLALYLLLT
jgi:protein phosphatase